MPMKKGKLGHEFINPWFDRFVDNAMNAPHSTKVLRLLHEQDLRHLANRSDFVAFSGLEDKLLLLSKLGYPFALVVGAPQTAPPQTMIARIVSVFFRALSFKRQDALRVMREKFFFILGDTEFLKGLKLGSNILHSPASASLPGYAFVNDLVYQYRHANQRTHMSNIAGSQTIDNIILKALQLSLLSHSQAFENIYGINEREYLVMAYLSKNKEVSLNDLTTYTQGMRLQMVLTDLTKKGFIETKRVVVQGTKTAAVAHYWLTGIGEHALNKARPYFIS